MEASTTGINFTGTTTVSGVAVANTTQLATKQDTLVSGTNIKTINSTSILGSGNISVVTSPSGVSGAIQFSNGSAFASDAANLFWDDTNNRLGVGTNAPIAGPLHVKTTTANANGSIIFGNNGAATILAATDTGSAVTQLQFRASSYNFADSTGVLIGGTYGATPTAMLQIKGSGSTSATTSLLVQNSAGSEALRIYDDRLVVIGTTIQSDNFSIGQSNANLKGINQSGSRILINYVNGGGVKFSNSSSGVATLIVGEVNENIVSFGGITSSFPALKRSSTTLQARLADDSGYAPIDASLYKVGGTNGFTGTGSYTNFTIVGGIITNAS
jgi:hypothetical protein